MQSTIRFLIPNRYRKAIGEMDSKMAYGIHQALVMRGVAEWVHNPFSVAVISQPGAAEQIPVDTPKRRVRRLETVEDRT